MPGNKYEGKCTATPLDVKVERPALPPVSVPQALQFISIFWLPKVPGPTSKNFDVHVLQNHSDVIVN